MELNEILQVAIRASASDIHLKAGLPPMFRVDGALVPLKDARRLPPEEVARMAFGIMSDFQKEKFKQTNEVDLAYGVPGLGRFRVNIFQQRGSVGGVFRVIPFKIQSIEQLMLPKSLEKLAGEQRGLILVTGTTGSGKSTTLAAMIDHINATETINRIISAFPPYQQKQVRLQLGSVLKGVVSQRLVPRADGHGRVPAIEVLLSTARVRELVEDKDRTKEIPDAIAQGNVSYGMQTFDQSLMWLLKSGVITYEEALRQATNPDDFALRVSGISGTSDSKWDGFEKPAEPASSPGRALPGAGAARPAAPKSGAASPADDDFQIERF